MQTYKMMEQRMVNYKKELERVLKDEMQAEVKRYKETELAMIETEL